MEPKIYDKSYLAGYDKISVPLQVVEDIVAWGQERDFPNFPVVLEKGVLEITDICLDDVSAPTHTAHLLFEIDEHSAPSSILITLYGSAERTGNSLVRTVQWKIAGGDIVHIPEERALFMAYAGQSAQEYTSLLYSYSLRFQFVMNYLAHFNAQPEERWVERREQHTKRKKAGKKKGGGNRVVHISKRVIRIGELPKSNTKDEQDTQEKRLQERHVEAWSVRGHYRTYKDGRKVWIKPQVRRAKGYHGEPDPKTYKITNCAEK